MAEKIEITLQVTNEVEAQERRDAWLEIVGGRKLTHAAAIDHGTEAIMERAQIALQTIETAIREHPTTGQAGRLVRFLTAGGRELQQWFRDYDIESALRLSERQEKAFAELPQKSGRDRYELLDEAVDDLIEKFRRNSSAPNR